MWPIGAVHLTVKNLESLVDYYRQHIGLQLHRRENGIAYLGAGGEDLLVLHHMPEARQVSHSTGLYHFALRVPTRADLAGVIQRFTERQTPIDGWADHLVSEALYLHDPEGNGIEVYRDRPREEWPRENDTIRMANAPLDFNGILASGSSDTPELLPTGTDMGHVHLRVHDIAPVESFYCGILGFDIVLRWHGALFISYDGYHHHLGLNIWESYQAPPPPQHATGLKFYELRLSQTQWESVLANLQTHNINYQQQDGHITLHDPAGNGILITYY